MTGRKPRAWTEDEIAVLRDPALTPPEKAKKIKVSVPTVRRKMDELDIPRPHDRKQREWTPDEIALCRQYPNKSLELIAGFIGVSKPTARRKIEALGIEIIKHRNGASKPLPARKESDFGSDVYPDPSRAS